MEEIDIEKFAEFEGKAKKTSLESYLKTLGAIFALVGFFWGIYEFRISQKWEKSKLLVELINSFEENEEIDIVQEILDYDERKIELEDTTIIFRNVDLIPTLRHYEIDNLENLTNEEMIIRDAFDEFFNFFEKLASFEKTKILKFDDLVYFYYWFDIVVDIKKYKPNVPEEKGDLQKAIDTYIESNDFKSMQYLLHKYKIEHKTPQ